MAFWNNQKHEEALQRRKQKKWEKEHPYQPPVSTMPINIIDDPNYTGAPRDREGNYTANKR